MPIDEYTHKFRCEYQYKDYDTNPNKRLNLPYCKHSTDPNKKGKITCPYLGKPVELVIEGKSKLVNLCEFLDGE